MSRGQGGRKRNRKRRKRCHERNLKRLTKEKNAAKKELRQARRGSNDVAVIHELSSRFHKLIRLHNKAKRVALQAQANVEAVKAHRICAKSVWEYASQLFKDGSDMVSPSFGQAEAERYFTRVY